MGKAAHFPGTGWPGGGTNIYIYGHAQDGMFIALWDARKGDGSSSTSPTARSGRTS